MASPSTLMNDLKLDDAPTVQIALSGPERKSPFESNVVQAAGVPQHHQQPQPQAQQPQQPQQPPQQPPQLTNELVARLQAELNASQARSAALAARSVALARQNRSLRQSNRRPEDYTAPQSELDTYRDFSDRLQDVRATVDLLSGLVAAETVGMGSQSYEIVVAAKPKAASIQQHKLFIDARVASMRACLRKIYKLLNDVAGLHEEAGKKRWELKANEYQYFLMHNATLARSQARFDSARMQRDATLMLNRLPTDRKLNSAELRGMRYSNEAVEASEEELNAEMEAADAANAMEEAAMEAEEMADDPNYEEQEDVGRDVDLLQQQQQALQQQQQAQPPQQH